MNKFLIERFVAKELDPANVRIRRRCGMLSGVIGIIMNLLMFSGKLTVGIFTSSIAATADAFNNLSDAGSSIVTMVCFKMAGNPADEEHPFGHGRIEYVSGLIVSVAIIITGLGFIKTSVEKIFTPENIELDIISIIILSASVLIKIWLNFFNRRLSNAIKSAALEATANDSVSDAAATLTVIAGIFFTRFFGLYLDPYAGLVVSIFIIITGSKTLKESIASLMGKAPDSKLIKEITDFVLSYPEVTGVSDLKVHNYGPGNSAVTLHAHIDTSVVNIHTVHEVIEDIEKKLSKRFSCNAVVRFEPSNQNIELKQESFKEDEKVLENEQKLPEDEQELPQK
ncbi:MAG: cation diffusion facilitator family transporter [Oscillospiraceae bacterium]|nr:cation diffusion facilitator family transporter [Oscillospiraceae bacterium]